MKLLQSFVLNYKTSTLVEPGILQLNNQKDVLVRTLKLQIGQQFLNVNLMFWSQTNLDDLDRMRYQHHQEVLLFAADSVTKYVQEM